VKVKPKIGPNLLKDSLDNLGSKRGQESNAGKGTSVCNRDGTII